MTTCVNIKRDQYDVYIGRGSIWGNPWGTKGGIRVAARAKAIGNYRAWLLGHAFGNFDSTRRALLLADLHLLRGKRLGCYCAPKACHGDILIELLERQGA